MAGTGTGACPSPRSRMSHTTRFSPDRSRRRAMKLLMALALASLPLPALAQAPAAADTDGKTAAGVQYVQPKDWTATTRGPAVLFVSPEKDLRAVVVDVGRSEEHTSELQSLMRISYAVFCLKKKNTKITN